MKSQEVLCSIFCRLMLSIVLAAAGLAQGQEASELEELRELVRDQQAVIQELQSRVEALEQKDQSAPPPLPQAEVPVIEESKHPNHLTAYWDKGLHIADEEERLKVDIGGRLQIDGAWFKHSKDFDTIGAFYPAYGLGDEQDALEFRRARLAITGKAYDYLLFRAEYDFAANSPGDDAGKFREVWLGLDKIPYVGTLRAGHFKEPFSLEEITTDNATTFMERGLPNVFAPSYNLGLAFQNTYFNKRVNWSAGLFKTVDDWPSDNDSDEDQGFAVSTRLTGLPWYQPEKKRLLHLGLSYSHRNPDGPVRFRAKPEVNLANFYANTGTYLGDDLDLYGAEAALVHGPLSLQGEYIHAANETVLAGDQDFSGYYLLGSWFLTGESRPYSTSSASFDTVVPERNFHPTEGGWGAWELALRYSALDLDDDAIRGGRLQDYTFGVNWYLNPNARIMLNYVLSNVDHDLYEGNFQALTTRFQVNF